MLLVALWCGFVGSWVLVTGSVFQAALELGEVNNVPGRDQASHEALLSLAEPPPPVSPWWWLLPPVGYILNRRRTKTYREAIMRRMDPGSLRQMVRFGQKATGWFLVSLGGFALAVKETAELLEAYDVGAVWWAVVVVAASVAAFSFTVVRLHRFERYLHLQQTDAADRPT